MGADVLVLLFVDLSLALAVGLWSRSRSVTALLIAYGLFLGVGGALSLLSSEPSRPGGTPFLAGSDGEGYFEDAVRLSEFGIGQFRELVVANYFGYQILLASAFSLFGARLVVAIIVNHVLLMCTVVALYRASTLLAASPAAGRLACIAFMLTTAHAYHAVLLLKEPAIGFSFALMLLAATEVLKGRGPGLRALAMAVLALAILMTMRGALLLFVLILLGFLGNLLPRRRSSLVVGLLVLTGLLGVAVPLAQEFTTHALDIGFVTETITLNTVVAATLSEGDVDTGGVVGRVSGTYLGLPFLMRLALFFIPTGLQLLLPFDFWSTAFLHDHFSAFLARNLNPLWFLFVAVWALFALVNVRRTEEILLRRFLLAGALFYGMIAVIYGGAIPRYASPALLFVYPAIGYWWERSRRDQAVRLRVRRFFRRYYAALLVLTLPYLALNFLRLL